MNVYQLCTFDDITFPKDYKHCTAIILCQITFKIKTIIIYIYIYYPKCGQDDTGHFLLYRLGQYVSQYGDNIVPRI